MPPKQELQTQGKRAREGSSKTDQDGDTIYLEMRKRIWALEKKKVKERVSTYGEDQMRNEDQMELIHIWDRRVKESELHSSSKKCNVRVEVD